MTGVLHNEASKWSLNTVSTERQAIRVTRGSYNPGVTPQMGVTKTYDDLAFDNLKFEGTEPMMLVGESTGVGVSSGMEQQPPCRQLRSAAAPHHAH